MRIVLEGNICAGKSTILNTLSHKVNIEGRAEPTQLWTSFGGNNLLKKFYDEPNKYAFELQLLILDTMSELLYKETTAEHVLFERSIFSSRYIFTEMAYESGLITKIQFDLLHLFLNRFVTIDNIVIDKIIYLQMSPHECFQRTLERNREEENNITLDYLMKLDTLYNNWLVMGKYPSNAKDIHVVPINSNTTVNDIANIISEIIGLKV